MASILGNPNYQITIQQEATQDNPGGTNIVAYMPSDFMYDAESQYEAPFAQGLLGNGMISNVAAAFGLRMVTPSMTGEIWKGAVSTGLSLKLEFFAETDAKADVRDKIVALMKLATPGVSKDLGLLTSPGPQLTIAGAQGALADSLAGYSKIAKATGADSLSALVNSLSKFVAPAAVNIGGPTLDTPTANIKGMIDTGTQCTTFDNAPNQNTPLTLGQADLWKKNVSGKVSIKIGNYAFFDCVVINKVQKTYESILDTAGRSTHAIVDIAFKPMFIVTQDDLDQIFL